MIVSVRGHKPFAASYGLAEEQAEKQFLYGRD